jgi:hypothetical protein
MKSALMIILIIFLSFQLYAQKKELYVAGTTLKLGMTRDQVLKLLPDHIQADSPGGNAFNLYDKDDKNKNYSKGTVIFNNNKVTMLCRDWPLPKHKQSNEVDAMNLLFSIFRNACNNSSIINSKIIIDETDLPDIKSKQITILIGKDWMVDIYIFEENIQIIESIGQDLRTNKE